MVSQSRSPARKQWRMLMAEPGGPLCQRCIVRGGLWATRPDAVPRQYQQFDDVRPARPVGVIDHHKLEPVRETDNLNHRSSRRDRTA